MENPETSANPPLNFAQSPPDQNLQNPPADYEPPVCPVCGRSVRWRRKLGEWVCTKCPWAGTPDEIARIERARAETQKDVRGTSVIRFDQIDFSKKG